MSSISKTTKNPFAPENAIPEEQKEKPKAGIIRRNAVPFMAGAGTATALYALLGDKVKNIVSPKPKIKAKPHSHGLSIGKLGTLAATASVIHAAVHPFTCGGGGMLLGASALMSVLPNILGGKHDHHHHHAPSAPKAPATPPAMPAAS